jgi:diguanylate cyclase (GGDEF)-like protein
MALAQAAVGFVLLAWGARFRRWVPGVVVVGGIGAVTGCTLFNGEGAGGAPMLNELFYVWPALYVGFFFSVRALVASLVLVAVAYAGVLQAHGIDGSSAVTRWLVVVSVVFGAAGAMHGIRRHVDGLVGRLREAARTDPLTGLLNRRGFEERFAVERLRAERSGKPVALLVGDLDHFKALNDELGHAGGDEALEAAAAALRDASRAVDAVARIGGEEFALVVPDCDAQGGVAAADRLRGLLTRVAPTTISFGVAEYPRDGESLDDLLRAADRALYAAKDAGRDRVIAYTPAPAPPRPAPSANLEAPDTAAA